MVCMQGMSSREAQASVGASMIEYVIRALRNRHIEYFLSLL